LIEQALVKWRDYDESVSHQGKGMHSSLDLHYDNEIRAHLKEWGFYLAYFHDSLGMFMKKRQNHPFYGNWIVRLGVKFIDPVAWHDWYWKKIKKFRYLLKPY
jgi:hypothetical protein